MKKQMVNMCVMVMVISLGLFGVVGCSNQEHGYDEESRSGKALNETRGVGILKTDQSRGRQLSDQNPNLPNTDRGRVDHDSYLDQARAVVEASGEFKVDSIWINGKRLWVTAYKKGQLTPAERVDAEARLHKKLAEAIPRYEIEVKVQEDRS